MNKLSEKLNQLFLPLVTGITCFFVFLLIFWILLTRNYLVASSKNVFLNLVNSLNQAGYDIAYDDVDFYSFSPVNVLTFKNISLYKISDNSWRLTFPQLSVNADLLNYKKLNLHISENIFFSSQDNSTSISLQESMISLRWQDDGINNLMAELKNINIQNIANIDNIKFALQRSFAKHINNDMTFLENYLEIANTQLNPMTFPNLPQKIDEFYINADILGKIDFKNSYFDDIKSWISSSGKIDIKKLILNWKPLVLVSKGTLNIDENFSSDLKLLSTSNGMLETLDIAENAGLFDKKGVFVAKIILGNKATPSSENDGTYTIISPINWSKQGLTLESVPLISYQQTENKNSQN